MLKVLNLKTKGREIPVTFFNSASTEALQLPQLMPRSLKTTIFSPNPGFIIEFSIEFFLKKSKIPIHFHLTIIISLYPAQQDNLDTSLSKVRAASFNPSAIVKYGARLSRKS